jgi:predicted dithiol-disulfide oxidoreductase (DUF899 family)
MTDEIRKTEEEIGRLVQKLATLRKEAAPVAVKNYVLRDLEGDVTLLELFAGREILLAIHNMGQGCRYCTLWADALNGLLPHLEDRAAVVLLSKDAPEVQHRFAASRHWRFRMASHGGGAYLRDQNVASMHDNMPGVVCYVRNGTDIFRKNATPFGPGDVFCAQWHLLSLAGLGEDDWTPQYNYWQRPTKLDDGGNNIL